MSNLKVAFIGLGAMGYHMAGHISKKYDVTVYNRTKQKSQDWGNEFDGKFADTIKDAVADADIVLTCIGNDNDVHDVYILDDGIIKNSKNGAILIDHTTTSADIAKVIYNKAKESNLQFMDAPVSGGEAGAINGVLTVMVGGDKETLDSVRDILNTYSKSITLMGDIGYGQITKMRTGEGLPE